MEQVEGGDSLFERRTIRPSIGFRFL